MRGDRPTIAYRNNSSPSWLNMKKERERTRKAVSGGQSRLDICPLIRSPLVLRCSVEYLHRSSSSPWLTAAVSTKT